MADDNKIVEDDGDVFQKAYVVFPDGTVASKQMPVSADGRGTGTTRIINAVFSAGQLQIPGLNGDAVTGLYFPFGTTADTFDVYAGDSPTTYAKLHDDAGASVTVVYVADSTITVPLGKIYGWPYVMLFSNTDRSGVVVKVFVRSV